MRGVSYRFKPGKIEFLKGRKSPYRFRWRVEEERHTRSFVASELAESFKASLIVAARNGEGFDLESGLPESMVRAANDVTVLQHLQEFLQEHWKRSAPKSRVAFLEAFTRAAPVLSRDLKGRPEDDVLRAALRKAFNKGDNVAELTASERSAYGWAEKASRPVSALNDPDVVTDLLDAFATRLDGAPAAPDYFSRRRRSMRTALTYAVRKKRLVVNPLASGNLPAGWSPPKGDDRVDPRSIGGPELVGRMIEHGHRIGPRQGPRFVAFFGCMFWAMMRPAEVTGLKREGCRLPAEGWGSLTFAESSPAAGKAYTDNGAVHQDRELKNRSKKTVRTVPIPPELVAMLRWHLDTYGVTTDGRLFRSENGNRIQPSTYWRLWQRIRQAALSSEQLLTPLMQRPYDLRHAGITWRLNAGVPVAEVAHWAGNSVEVITRIYAQCVKDLEREWIKRMNASLAVTGSSYSGSEAFRLGDPVEQNRSSE